MDPIFDVRQFDLAIERLGEKAARIEAQVEAQRSRLAELESELRDVLDRLERANEVRHRAEQTAAELAAVLGEELKQEQGAAPAKTNFERIVEHFLNLRNRPLTIPEIETGTGIPRSSVAAVVYRTHPERFKQYPQPGNKPNTWRLRGPDPLEDDPFDNPPSGGEEIPF